MLEKGTMMRLFAPVQRVDEGSRMVYGVFVSDAPVDEFGQPVVLDWDATRAAVEAWRAWGNIREMHGLTAAGIAREITLDDAQHVGRVGAYIVDDGAWKKVQNNVYKGFSIGATPLRWEIGKGREDPVRVTEYEIVEVSLVDRPKDPTSVIEMWRAADAESAPPVLAGLFETAVERVMTRILAQGGATVSVLERVWAMAMGGDEATVPESPEEALELLRAALMPEVAPEPESVPLSDVQRVVEAQAEVDITLTAHQAEIAALREEMGGLAQALSTALERVQQLEQMPAPLPVSRAAAEDAPDAKTRIAELERLVRTKRLSPDTPEVQELAQLYQARRNH